MKKLSELDRVGGNFENLRLVSVYSLSKYYRLGTVLGSSKIKVNIAQFFMEPMIKWDDKHEQMLAY